MQPEHDYIVVGGGTSGVIVAVRLAEAGADVCLVEAGPAGEHDPRILEYRRWIALLGSEYDFDYAIAPQQRGNSHIRHARARVLGGCSSHNSVIAIASPNYDMQLWESMGAAGWGPAGTRDQFRRVFERVHTTVPPPVSPCAGAFMAAAAEAGFPTVDLRRPDVVDGAAWLPLNVRDDIRQSSAVAYLFPLDGPQPRPAVYTETPVRSVLLDGNGRAAGVDTARGPIMARNEVILCAGAFDSPRLLMHSGLGPARHLRELGLPVAVDLPAVGEHLQDHVECVVVWEAARPIPPAACQRWENGLFARFTPGAPSFDMMLHFGTEPYYVDFAALGYPLEQPEHVFCMTPNVARPRSEGSVRLRSADPEAPPLIDPCYFTDPDGYDERVLVEGIRLSRRLAAQPALAPWVGQELAPGPDAQSDEALGRYARRCSNTVYHPAGTCRMGPAASDDAVVDPALRVRGVAGLRVADASVFPTMIGVNLCMTVMMVGEKCAELILADA
jgi:choline dehydrogenase-like flavoprotein